jgi:uncharacterized membrane-anchored protein
MRKWIALTAGILSLLAVNFTIYTKETLLTKGRKVLLELVPVDPRSLMQGDYMALHFKVADVAFGSDTIGNETQDGRIVLKLDAQDVGHFVRIDDGTALASDEVFLRYRIRDSRPILATNAFFFQEGTGSRYRTARYGEFRVDSNGEALLATLQ